MYGEIVYDLAPALETIATTVLFDNSGTGIDTRNYTGSVRVVTAPTDLASGVGKFARNVASLLNWTVLDLTGGPPVTLYAWEPSFLERPEDTFLRGDDWGDAGYKGSKYIRGFLLEADTEGTNRSITLQGDQTTLQTYTNVNHNGQVVKVYPVNPPEIATLVRILPTDAGSWRTFRVSYVYEEIPELVASPTPFLDGGSPGAKLVRGVLIEGLGSAETLIEYDGGLPGPTLSLVHTGSWLVPNPYSFIPFIAHQMRLSPATAIRLGKIAWIYDPYPELAAIRTAFTDEGNQGAKFIQGIVAEAMGTSSVVIEADGGNVVGPTLAMNHTGPALSQIPYVFEPFIAYELRLAPASPIRLGRLNWIWEPAPDLATLWVTQGTSHDIAGYQFLKDGYIAHISSANLTLSITVDGTTFVYTILSSGGVYRKDYIVFALDALTTIGKGIKGKLFTYSLSSAQPFRLFIRDSEVRVHAWNGGGYQIKQPFGNAHRSNGGARI